MASGYKIPNKLFYIYSWVAAVLLILWLITYNKYLALLAGTVSLVYAILVITRPQMQPRATFLFPVKDADQFFYWTQRAFGVLIAIFSIFILINYRITNSRELGIVCLMLVGFICIVDALWLIFFSKGASHNAKSYITFSLVFLFLFFLPGGIFMIYRNSPLDTSKMAWLPGAIGGAIGCVIFTFWARNQKY